MYNITKRLQKLTEHFGTFLSGNETDRVINPTVYRVPQNYMDMIESVQVKAEHDMYGYEVVLSKSIQAYAKVGERHCALCDIT